MRASDGGGAAGSESDDGACSERWRNVFKSSD
jgi:hypothetical protein